MKDVTKSTVLLSKATVSPDEKAAAPKSASSSNASRCSSSSSARILRMAVSLHRSPLQRAGDPGGSLTILSSVNRTCLQSVKTILGVLRRGRLLGEAESFCVEGV